MSADQKEQLIPLLKAVWNGISNTDTTNLLVSKLWRIENVMWQPPKLTFEIERHGWTVFGSTRADLHTWEVDTEKAQAHIVGMTYRQLVPRDKPFKAVQVVQELRDIIVKGRKDDRIEYKNAEKTIVKILVGKAVPASNKETRISRRKKFRPEMQKRMAEKSWKEKSLHTYERVSN